MKAAEFLAMPLDS